MKKTVTGIRNYSQIITSCITLQYGFYANTHRTNATKLIHTYFCNCFCLFLIGLNWKYYCIEIVAFYGWEKQN